MTVFNTLGVAVVDVDPDQAASIASVSTGESAFASIEPEPIFFAFAGELAVNAIEYLRGYKDAVDHLYEKLVGGPGVAPGMQGIAATEGFQDTDEATWGVIATKVVNSRSTGCTSRSGRASARLIAATSSSVP